MLDEEGFDNYNDTSAYSPKGHGKRAAGPLRCLPPAKKPTTMVTKKKAAAKAKKPATVVEKDKAAPKAKRAKRVKPAIIVASIDFGTT